MSNVQQTPVYSDGNEIIGFEGAGGDPGTPTEIAQAGGSVSVNADGSVSVLPVAGQPASIVTPQGNITLNSDGSLSITNANGLDITANVLGEISINSGGGHFSTIEMDQLGNIKLKDGAALEVLLQTGGNIRLTNTLMVVHVESDQIKFDNGTTDMAFTDVGEILLNGSAGSAGERITSGGAGFPTVWAA